MFIRKFTILLFLGFIGIKSYSQSICPGLGQTPGSAFPVCGTDTFKQTTVPVCGGRAILARGCDDVPLTDINLYYYQFTFFLAGILGFVINLYNFVYD